MTPAFSTEPIRRMFPEDSIAVSCGVVSPAFLQVARARRLHMMMGLFLMLPQKLEMQFAAELNDKHCVDISALVPDEFEADTEAFSQRMPQVMSLPPGLQPHTCDRPRSCSSTATCY
jgi:hypothetical protein